MKGISCAVFRGYRNIVHREKSVRVHKTMAAYPTGCITARKHSSNTKYADETNIAHDNERFLISMNMFK